jgi:class 3 adenylate cyclase
VTCPVCGTVAVTGARFCHQCGSALPAAVTVSSTERRVVTVLFGDLSEFTAWSEELDPERVGAVTDRVHAATVQAVTAFGGRVDKLIGDGIMAVFGAPVAHEDDPERAVRAALAMQRAVRRVVEEEEGGGRRLGLRVGINTGPVAAGVQPDLSYTVVGDTVNTAARLSDAAGVGGVYAGAATARATRDRTAWRRLPPLRLKGKREPVEAYELLGLRDAPGTRPGLGDEAPFVGREAEFGRLTGRLSEAEERGSPQVVVVTAEPGMGKTRLAAEVARHASEIPGGRSLRVRVAPFGDGRLAPLAGLVRQACGVERGDDPERAAEKVRRVVARRGVRRSPVARRFPPRTCCSSSSGPGWPAVRRRGPARGRPGRGRATPSPWRWRACSARSPPRGRCSSSSTTCTTPRPRPSRPSVSSRAVSPAPPSCCSSAGPSSSVPPEAWSVCPTPSRCHCPRCRVRPPRGC